MPNSARPARIQRASTDANVPLSLGREAIAIGAGGTGGGAHTIHEWYDPSGRDLGLNAFCCSLSRSPESPTNDETKFKFTELFCRFQVLKGTNSRLLKNELPRCFKGRTFRCAVKLPYFCHHERALAREGSAFSTFP